MFLFLHGLALLFGFLTGFSGGSGGPIHLSGGAISSPMDGGGSMPGGAAPADGGGSMPGNGPGGGGGG
jgi:hypothetical protein